MDFFLNDSHRLNTVTDLFFFFNESSFEYCHGLSFLLFFFNRSLFFFSPYLPHCSYRKECITYHTKHFNRRNLSHTKHFTHQHLSLVSPPSTTHYTKAPCRMGSTAALLILRRHDDLLVFGKLWHARRHEEDALLWAANPLQNK